MPVMHAFVRASLATVVVAFAVLAAPPVSAQKVYTCKDGASGVVYQQTPCAKPSQEQTVREFASEPARPQPKQAPVSPAADGHYPGRQANQHKAEVPKAPRRPPLDRSRTPEQQKQDQEILAASRYGSCQEARDEQKKLLARVGRSVSAMRAAEAKVSRACR